MAVEERWFTPGELGQMSRPTMDRAIEAIEAGDSDLPLEPCRGVRHEWRFLHDLIAESMLGLVTITEDEEKFTFEMSPCGSGQRLWRNGAYSGEDPHGVTEETHEWSYGREGFSLCCTHRIPDEYGRRYGLSRAGA